jgi:hypothetical protein
MAQKKLSRTRQEIHSLYEENELASLKQNQSRARSFSVGTASGGVIELNMRGDFSNLWHQMQPTEAIEIIGQLAAASGIEIVMRPRQDFAAWRSWDASLPSCVQWMGAAPWQLSDEDRNLLAEAKAKNIKAIVATDDSKSE